jgi:hypothetical protein
MLRGGNFPSQGRHSTTILPVSGLVLTLIHKDSFGITEEMTLPALQSDISLPSQISVISTRHFLALKVVKSKHHGGKDPSPGMWARLRRAFWKGAD